jgi:protein TonB
MHHIFSILFSFLLSAQSFAQDSTITVISCGEASDIYTTTEIDPMFPGGVDSMMNFIAKNFVIPGTCVTYSFIIYVGFIVNTDGSLTDVKILKGSETALDDEAIRVVQLMPKWIPGQVGGVIVRSRFVIPFSIKNK